MKSLFITLASCGIAQLLSTYKLVEKASKVCQRLANCTKSIPGVRKITKGLKNYFVKLHLVLSYENKMFGKSTQKLIKNLIKNDPKIIMGAQTIINSRVTNTFGKLVLNTLKHHTFSIVKGHLIQKGAEYLLRQTF